MIPSRKELPDSVNRRRHLIDKTIQTAIDKHLIARHELIVLGRAHPTRIGGNDNIVGRIGEFIALRFLESLGRHPTKVSHSSNTGFDLIERDLRIQIKVITEENREGRTVRITEPWDQLIVIELGAHYKPIRIGLLTKDQHRAALADNTKWSHAPIVRRTMVGHKGLISRYGRVYQQKELRL
jgi:hypothetical protein